MSDSDCDWFDKDEEELLRDVQRSVEKKKKQQAETEYIEATNTIEDYVKELSIKAAEQPQTEINKSIKMNITELRKLANMSPLDLLLHIMTLEYDFFSDQIHLNDSPERVMLYTSALATVCHLELPGFLKDILKPIAFDDNLQQRYRLLLAKLMCKKFKDMWRKENEILQFLTNMEFLMLKSFKLYRKIEKINLLLKDVLSILKQANNPTIAKKGVVTALKANISRALASEDIKENMDIFPTLENLKKEEVTLDSPLEDMPSTSQQTDQEYLSKHLKILKHDFFSPLKDCFDLLKNKSSTTELPDNLYVFEDVFIVLNEKFLDAYRHELVFVDVLGSKRKLEKEKIVVPYPIYDTTKRLKAGALLCFSTSYNFDNLILATVTFTSQDCLNEGFIGIEIARQYNIGNIYGQKLIMFETPEFFEPYHNVFNYFKNCTISDIHLKKYFVDAEIPDKHTPQYLSGRTKYYCCDKVFKPLTDKPPPGVLGLNTYQLKAFKKALTQELSLIQGPPGTGKTHLSVKVVKTLIENAETPVVLITYTNESLDKFLIKISEYTDKIIRFGGQSRDPAIAKYNIKDIVERTDVNPKLKRLYFLVNTEFMQKFKNLQQKHKDFDNTEESYQEIVKAQHELAEVNEKLLIIKIMFQYYMAKEKSIIAFTTTCAAKINFLFRLLKSKIVVFEEAAEISEPHVLACLTPYTQHVIMIGDHMQLRPYTSNYQLKHRSQMNVSFFEKIFKKQENPMQLKMQYRMHPDIADLLCGTFYHGLESDVSVTRYPPVRKMAKHLYFMQHQNDEDRSQHNASLYNNFEIQEIIKLAIHLVEVAKYDSEDIHILSPYSKQVDYIKKHLAKRPSLKSVKASTVDSFQGLESKIILLSLVRSNLKSNIGFLKEPNRICVALSRAKHAMYIIGNITLLSQCSTHWSDIWQKLIKKQQVGPKFPIVSS